MAERHLRGLSLILVATAVAGLGGYAITTVAARGLGPVLYSSFAVFWASLYLLVGTLSGIQQETSRAARPGSTRGGTTLALLIGGATLVVAVVLTGGMALLSGVLFPAEGWMLGIPLIVGPVASVTVAAITGLLYGVRASRTLAVVIIADVALRLVGITIVLLARGGLVLVAWASVLPFVVMAVGLMAALRWGRHLRIQLDVGLRSLAVHVVQTVGGAIGISLLVSGFPLFVRVLSPQEDAASVGVLVYALILTRAPLVVSVLAMQSYLVVFLRDRRGHLVRAVVAVLGILAAVGVVLAALAYVFGPAVVTFLAGAAFRIPPMTLALLVVVSIVTAGLAVSGAAVLSRRLHAWYVSGWALAAVISVALLALPGDLDKRVIVALAAGPLVGIFLHLIALRRSGASASSPVAAVGSHSR